MVTIRDQLDRYVEEKPELFTDIHQHEKSLLNC